jgi:hypothetical protein
MKNHQKLTKMTPDINIRIGIIEAVNKPINFMVLVLLMVEGLLGGLIFRFEDKFDTLLWIIVAFFGGFVLIVLVLGIWRPEVLIGKKNWDKKFSDRLADNIYGPISGSLNNLKPQERIEAWQALQSYLDSEDSGDTEFDIFSKRIGKRIERNAHLQNFTIRTQGRINE